VHCFHLHWDSLVFIWVPLRRNGFLNNMRSLSAAAHFSAFSHLHTSQLFSIILLCSKYMDFFVIIFNLSSLFEHIQTQSISCAISGSHINIFRFFSLIVVYNTMNIIRYTRHSPALCISGFVLFWPFVSHYFRFYLIRKALCMTKPRRILCENSIPASNAEKVFRFLQKKTHCESENRNLNFLFSSIFRAMKQIILCT
jgi:hypothetical protein